MYDLDIKPEADKIFRKLAKKNSKQLIIINKKIYEIRNNPYHKYKFLKKPLQNFNRIRIDTKFILICQEPPVKEWWHETTISCLLNYCGLEHTKISQINKGFA